MSRKLTNLIFVFTVLTIAHHLYAGQGNPWDPRYHDDNQNVTNDENLAQAEQPEELE